MSIVLRGFQGMLVLRGAGLERMGRVDELTVVGLRCLKRLFRLPPKRGIEIPADATCFLTLILTDNKLCRGAFAHLPSYQRH